MNAFGAPGRCVLLIMMIAMAVSCARLPEIKPVEPAAMPDMRARCLLPFPDMPCRFIHSIEVSFPGGKTGTVIGVTLIDPAAQTLHGVIMTIEGFVLFDARYEREVRVNRAVPPFDKEQFGGRMMEDIKLIFFAPHGKLSDAGMRDDGSTICRYFRNTGIVEDIIIHANDSWEIEKYSDSHELLRQVKAYSVRDRIPERIELNAFGFRGYSLRMKLISAEAVSSEVNRVPSGDIPEDEE